MTKIDLSRAFAPTPESVHLGIERGLAKGERRMKLRHKVTGMLSVATLMLVVIGIAAIAANRMTMGSDRQTPLSMPRTDRNATVYTTQSGRFYHSDPTCSGMEDAKPILLTDVENSKSACPVCMMPEQSMNSSQEAEQVEDVIIDVLGGSQSESFEEVQLEPITAQEAIASVLREDSKLSEKHCRAEVTASGTCAYVIGLYSQKEALFDASFWQVTSKGVTYLGGSKECQSWGLSNSEPPVFYAALGKKDQRSVVACTTVNGVPKLISNTDGIVALVPIASALQAMVNSSGYDYAFLRTELDTNGDPYFVQIEGTVITRDELLKINGGKEKLDLVESCGYTITDALYWDRSAIALNCTRDGKEWHVYLYWQGGSLYLPGGWWGDDLGMLEGCATPSRELNMDTVKTAHS